MSFKISIPKNTAFSGDHMGLVFTRGTAYTDDRFLATRLRSKGYTAADGEASAERNEAPDEDFPRETPEAENPELYEMTVPQLKEYAAEKGVDLGGARTKSEILAAISAAETGR